MQTEGPEETFLGRIFPGIKDYTIIQIKIGQELIFFIKPSKNISIKNKSIKINKNDISIIKLLEKKNFNVIT